MVQQKESAIAKMNRRAIAQLIEVCTLFLKSCALWYLVTVFFAFKTLKSSSRRLTNFIYIQQGKSESAKIRVENIIREDINVELLEILELYCELLLARIGLMDAK